MSAIRCGTVRKWQFSQTYSDLVKALLILNGRSYIPMCNNLLVDGCSKNPFFMKNIKGQI